MRGQNMRLLMGIYLGVIASYILVKFAFRPFVLVQEYTGPIKIFVLSYPNFCEAVAGSIILTFILLTMRGIMIKRAWQHIPTEPALYLLAVLIAAPYVLLQEFKVHNLGGVNVYDPYDVVFSVMGLLAAYFLLIWIEPKLVNR